MSKFKKTNKVSMDNIFVVKGDQIVPTGEFVTATTAFNLADGQLGVLAWDFDSSTTPLGEFKLATDDSNEVQAIKLVVGTPKSNASHTVSVWEDGDLAYQESGVVNKTNIRSVAVKLPEYPTAGAQLFEFNITPEADTEYKAYLRLISVRNDRDYGDNDEVIHAIVPGQDTAPDQTTVLETLVYDLDLQSKATFLMGNGSSKKGNRNFVAFGIDFAGGSGTAIGTIVPGDVVPFLAFDGVESNIVFDEALCQTFATFIAQGDSPLSATATIEVVDGNNLGALSLNGIVVVGLPETRAAAYDDVEQLYVRPELNLAGGFTLTDTAALIYKATPVSPKEGTGQGWKWLIEWRHRAGLAVHTAQIQPRADYFLEGLNYIDPDAFYTSYILEYYNTEDTLTNTEVSPFKTTLLFAATANATDDVDTISGDDGVYTFATTGTTTVTFVNNILDAWLEHARTTGNPFSLKGDIAGGGVYLQ